MFAAPHNSSPRKRSTSHSTDDHSSAKDRPRRLFQRYAHDLTMSSQSLAITSSSSHHDDLPTPSAPTHPLHTTSAHSTPMTSPSTGYSSLFQGSLSSATSESAPSAEYRSEFGLLTSGSSAYSPVHGSVSSRSSHPVSPWSRSTTESPTRIPCKSPSRHSSHLSSTAPHSPPLLATAGNAANTPAEHHTRSHSRLAASIKNFLSRPVVPSPSRFSFNSSTTPSDTEASSRSFQVPAAAGKWSMTPRKSRPPNLEISGGVAAAAAAMPSPSRGSNPPTDVHRRYASEAAAKIYNARAGIGHPRSQESLDLSVQDVPPVIARGRDPKTRNVLRRRPSGSAKFKAPEQGISNPSRPHEGDADLPSKAGTSRLTEVPFPLTPAGAVVEAYKQQELHRDDVLSPPKLSIDDWMSPRASHDGGYDREHSEHSPTPYYTVFGSSSERRGQAGGPDDRWGRFEADQLTWNTSQATPSHQPSVSDPSSHCITHKVSSKWRKVKEGGVTSEESPARDRGHSKGRPSLQEMRRSDKSGTRSTGRSMDSVSNTRDSPWSSPIAGHARSGSEKDGGNFWQLMRRISTGGLRDRFQFDKVVPPVPAIPKELLEKVNQGEHSNEPVSMSRHQPSSSSHDKDHTPPSKNISLARPSVVIASTSSNSSDVASTQFFHKTHSARSSVTSYGEAVVASHIPEIALDQHIIAPLEQLRLGEDHAESGELGASSVPVPRSPRRSASVPAGLGMVEDAEGEHVPLSSLRRQTCSGESSSSSSWSPASTSTPASGSARVSHQSHGLGVRQSQMVDGIVSLSPPPRPARNSRRGGSTASSPSHSILVKQVDGGVGIGIGGARQMDRTPSAQSDMTARAETPEPRRSRDQDASPHTRTGFTFRELGAHRRPPLSEREKVNIWNDLLDRSDKAGGTLHINGAEELMSDNMRFSTYSEI